mmetsp:Transcript_12229/g.56667  ORF Transcript_12229/g.56667 Transcript_12229/m.56667 type:complete len:203 (-) Transcript_12229:936-1544(-)
MGVVTSSEDARTTDAGATAASDAAPSNAERRDVDDDVLGASRSLSFDESSDAVARGRMDRAPRSSRARETDRGAPMRTVGARPTSDDMCTTRGMGRKLSRRRARWCSPCFGSSAAVRACCSTTSPARSTAWRADTTPAGPRGRRGLERWAAAAGDESRRCTRTRAPWSWPLTHTKTSAPRCRAATEAATARSLTSPTTTRTR